MGQMAIDVHLAHVGAYEHVEPALFDILDMLDIKVPETGYVLLKPNLISSRNSGLACTHPAVVRAAVRYFLDKGCPVVVGDSPAFGSAQKVADSNGLTAALHGMGARFVSLDCPQQTEIGPFTAGISKWALEAGLIVNLPKVKAHCQMGISGGVKNLFGTICGFRKAWVHFRQGDKENRFPSFFVHLMHALPRTITLMDGITAMHKTGPTHGEAYALGFLGGSCSTVALDTALYQTLGLEPKDVPIWEECIGQGIRGALTQDVRFPQCAPEDFPGKGFEVPKILDPQVFGPGRLVRSLGKRLWGKVGR
jgi:uncharacterized protein (DUF362 family)